MHDEVGVLWRTFNTLECGNMQVIMYVQLIWHLARSCVSQLCKGSRMATGGCTVSFQRAPLKASAKSCRHLFVLGTAGGLLVCDTLAALPTSTLTALTQSYVGGWVSLTRSICMNTCAIVGGQKSIQSKKMM